MTRRRGRSFVAGALLAALLSSISVTLVTHLWSLPLHVPFQYAHAQSDDEQDATLDMMLIKNISETGWFDTNPKLNAPFAQHWAEWPMGGDLLAYTVKKALVDTTGDVPLTFNLFWLLTFPVAALAAFPALRALRCSWSASVVGAVLFSVAPYHFRNGAAHENLAFYVGVPTIVLLCVKVLGPDSALPSVSDLRHRAAWWRVRWLLLGAVLVGVTGIYYLAFLLSLLAVCSVLSALASRRPGRLLVAALFGAVGLATSVLANLPTLLYRWQHTTNLLGVPVRQQGESEYYPLRVIELLSPVTGHRFGPFAALADRLYQPGQEGLATANLGFLAAIGFACAVVAVLVRALRTSDRRGWSLEARLGVVALAALLVATEGGLNRALELLGLQGVRAWNRIAIVVAFASIVVFARLLDRLRVLIHRRRGRHRRVVWTGALAFVVVIGVLDQASPALMPHPAARASLWRSDGAFVAAIEQRLPHNAMVFQLPVTDFPEKSAIERLSAYDLIKEGYLHSKTLRWSAGGMRGRDGEWQWPASTLPVRDLARGLIAMGFSGLTIDRAGFADHGSAEVDQLRALLGAPIAAGNNRLLAWDLRPVSASLLGDASSAARRTIAQQLLDAPRLYLTADADPITDRGASQSVCGHATLTLVNPAARSVRRKLVVTLDQRRSATQHGSIEINRRAVNISVTQPGKVVPVDIPPGATTIAISVDTPGVRCRATPTNTLPSIAVRLDSFHH